MRETSGKWALTSVNASSYRSPRLSALARFSKVRRPKHLPTRSRSPPDSWGILLGLPRAPPVLGLPAIATQTARRHLRDMRTLINAFALSALLSIAACGGAADPGAMNTEGFKKLDSQDHAGALESFEASLAAIGEDTGHADYKRARLGAVEAQAYIDGQEAAKNFMAFAKAAPSTVDGNDFARIGGILMNAKAFKPAVDVVDAGIKAFPEKPELDALIKAIEVAAAKAGDKSATSALDSLGYLGGD